MFGKLSEFMVDEILTHQLVGRIACQADGIPYIIPISYAYDGKYIYCHSEEGRKVEMMRKNPRICFQVEEMNDMANWRSVIVDGTYEELIDKNQRNAAMQFLLNRYLPMISSVTTHLGEHWPFQPDDPEDIKGVIFRIAILHKSGRFESNVQSPFFPG